jgi:cytochrome P450
VSALDDTNALRPGATGLAAAVRGAVVALEPAAFAVLRAVWPIPHLGKLWVVTRYDDVLEVFADDASFGVVYRENLDVITGGQPFFLGMGDTPHYRQQLDAMRRVFLAADLTALGDQAEALAEQHVAATGARVEIVALIRDVTFGLIAAYLGIPPTPRGNIAAWATRLFEYQFTGSPKDVALRAEVDEIAPAFRRHIDEAIARRKAAAAGPDDVLGRCLAHQAADAPGYSDVEIRTALLCMMVGGPPQPPMVVPQAMEQLLRRPAALAAAAQAAREDDDPALHDIVFEAMRFDPLAPGLPRVALKAAMIARGTAREASVAPGDTVLACFASAMMDPRRVADPSVFRAGRPSCDYVHFGHGLHECFGRFINHATLHRMLKPLLRRPDLRRAPGSDGKLRKNGIFAERLVVLHG